MMSYEKIDQRFLDALKDYKVGAPVPAKPAEGASWAPRTVDEMKADGVVGIYTTRERLADSKIMVLTGWLEPDKALGVVFTE
jgi:hypothetical protein